MYTSYFFNSIYTIIPLFIFLIMKIAYILIIYLKKTLLSVLYQFNNILIIFLDFRYHRLKNRFLTDDHFLPVAQMLRCGALLCDATRSDACTRSVRLFQSFFSSSNARWLGVRIVRFSGEMLRFETLK